MDLTNPSTYAEWYWGNSVDASKAYNEQIEKAMSAYFGGILGDIPEINELPAGSQNLLYALANPPHAGLGDFIIYTGAETAAEMIKDAIAPSLSILRRAVNKRSLETWLNSEQAITLSQRKKITDDFLYSITKSEGYEDIIADHLYTSKLPYPTIPEIIQYSRYHDYPDNPKETAWKLFNIPPDDWELWNWLSQQKFNTEQVLSLYKRQIKNQYDSDNELAQLGWGIDDRKPLLDLAYTLPNAMLLVQGNLMQGANNETIISDISKADIHPDYANLYLDGILTKPSSTDIINYQLRQDPLLTDLSNDLRRIGIHPDYHNLYKELAYQIPPVADIITMAVREAFTPDIAAKFGQYEDLPQEYVSWVGKKGLSAEWASRYWAAHWSLPSPQQGFEMLHRGIITKEDLSMLLRALDIMPFWRNKLIDMAYQPLTRIDVRRMYQLGVLNESQVKESYKQLGYDEINSDRMTEFTVKQLQQSLSKFSSSDVIRAFTKRFIESGEARSLLLQTGVKDSEIEHILTTSIIKRDWSEKDEQITAIENLYKKGIHTESQTRNELTALRLPLDYITTLLQQWQLKAAGEKVSLWTNTQTLSFLKKGIITKSRAITEFVALGYDNEHIEVYLASAQPAQ